MRHSIALRHLRSPLAVVTVILSLISHSNAYKNRNSAHSDQFLNRFHLNDDLSDDVDVVHEVDRIYQNHGRYQMTERREYISRGKDKENLGRYPQPYFAEETSEDCSVFPNQTLFEPHFFSCSENTPFKLHDLALSNNTGDYVYPLDLSQPLRVFLDLTSKANRRYDNIRGEVSLYRRSVGWLGCGWFYIPTLGLVDNYDICAGDNLSCPVYEGRQVVEVVLSPNVLFLALMKLIHSDRVPYQVQIRLINNRSSSEELLCAVFQSRIDF